MARAEQPPPTGEQMIDALRARQLRFYARSGDIGSFQRHVSKMLRRDCGPDERLQLAEIIDGTEPSRLVIEVKLRDGSPRGPRDPVRTGKRGPVSRDVIGKTILDRLDDPAARRGSSHSAAVGWALGYYGGITRPLAISCLDGFREKQAREQAARAKDQERERAARADTERRRANWPIIRALLDSEVGRRLYPDAAELIAFGDRVLAG